MGISLEIAIARTGTLPSTAVRALVLAAKVYTHANELQLVAARVALAGNVAQAYVNFARAEEQARSAREFVASRSALLRTTSETSVGIKSSSRRTPRPVLVRLTLASCTVPSGRTRQRPWVSDAPGGDDPR